MKAVIFDIGRVIVQINLNRLLEPLASLTPAGRGPNAEKRRSPQEVWEAIESDSRWPDWQQGRMTPREWHEHLTGRLGVTLGFADFCEAWNRALDPAPVLDECLFEGLAKRYRLALLSNTDPLHVAHLETTFAFVRHFPVRVYSCTVGACKPSKAIYAAAIEALAVRPAEALYIDDIEEYATAARRLGMEAIHFQTPAQLLRQLSARGFLD